MRTLLAMGGLVAAASAQFTLVAPNGYATAEGGANNIYPWNRGASSTRIQFVTDSTHFTSQGATFPILITQLRYRADAATATTTWPGGTWPQVRIDLATCPVDYLAVTSTFASNLGPDVTTVHNGPVTVAGGTGNGTGIPGPWYITIPITPFVYDPNLGDLVVDIYQDGTGWTGTSRAADHVSTGTPASLGSRIYNIAAGALTAATGTVGLNYAAVTEFTYTPANGLYSAFTANVTSGNSPLTVSFTDQTFTSTPSGITSWAWDFDGDNVVDSTAQNPTFTYTTCGDFNVTLTTTDGVFPPSTLTKTAYIKTDDIVANFTHAVVGPLTVQFTDTSSPAATAWAWDLDGDNIVDSNAQNPVWVYANQNAVNVTLTATRSCKSNAVTRSVVPAQQLTTNLAANNGGASLWTVYFNMDVLNPAGVDISAFDSISSSVNTAFTVDAYLKQGGYSGNEYVAAPWTLVGTASGTSNAVANQPSFAQFAQALHVPAGSYGVALRYIGIVPRYVTLGALTTIGNGDISLTCGSTAATTVAPFQGTTTTINSPRMWSGTLYYGSHNVTGLAGHGFFAQGCAGTAGTSHQTYITRPQLGGTLSIACNNLPFALGVMVVGTSNTISGFGPLPVDLGFIGAPGCPLHVSLDGTDTVVGAGTTATWNFPIPNVPALNGLLFYNQLAVLDPTANAFGLVMGDAAGWVLGG
ncbi:MAG: PKD domain-containing protein [Planctomycetes bacterium]|nr:PKD domain-containing protein [Planctomycetota bacterium]